MNLDATIWMLSAPTRMSNNPAPATGGAAPVNLTEIALGTKPPPASTGGPFDWTRWALGQPQPRGRQPVDRMPSLDDFIK